MLLTFILVNTLLFIKIVGDIFVKAVEGKPLFSPRKSISLWVFINAGSLAMVFVLSQGV